MVALGAEYPSTDVDRASKSARYLVVVESGESGWGAYVPDLPGVVAAAETEDEVRTLIAEAIDFHVEGLREEGEIVPAPASKGVWIGP
jgi:predicted RNase H-like HicB family nuclease